MADDSQFQRKYGPWALVCGASEGLGAAYADGLAQRGLNLVLVARRAALLDSAAGRLRQQTGVQVRTLALDLSHPAAPGQISQETGDLEIGLLVYNAARSIVGPFFDCTLDEHLAEIDTNVRAPLALVYHFGQGMLERRRGGIILMSSLSAFQGSAYISNYSATKAYNLVLGEGLWEEWRERGVDVLSCLGGAIRTPNYLSSEPSQKGGAATATLEPEQVVREALRALGRQPQVIPGRSNRLASLFMRRILPRRMAIQVMGRILRAMYVHE